MKMKLFRISLPWLVLAVLLPVLALLFTAGPVGAAGCCGGPAKPSHIFRVYVSPSGGGDVEIRGRLPGSYPFVRLIEEGERIHLEATPADGYYFIGWSGALSGDENSADVTIFTETNITAQFFPEEIVSQDKRLQISFREGTIVQDRDGTPLCDIELAIADTTLPQLPGAEIVGDAYELGPHGATFNWPATLSFSYDPAEIPTGVAEEELFLGYYDDEAEEWLVLSSGIDVSRDTLSTRVDHFSTFAVMAPVAPPPMPAAFTTSALNISPLEAGIGETVTISVLVTNTGEVEGSYNLDLELNGTVIETKEITMASGSQEVVFSLAGGEVGSYSVEVNGLAGSFTVTESSPSSLSSSSSSGGLPGAVVWTIVGLAIAALVIPAIVILIAKMRRDYDDYYYY